MSVTTSTFPHPGDFRSWESPQTLPALFIGPFEGVERFRNLKFAVIRITDIQKTVLSFFEGTTAIHFAFKQRLINNKQSYYYSNGPAKIYTEVDCDWWRPTFGDSQESPGYNIIQNFPICLSHSSVFSSRNNFKFGIEASYMVLWAVTKFGGINHNLHDHIFMPVSHESHH